MALSDAQGYYNPVIGETTSYITPTDAKNAIAQMYTDLLSKTGGTLTGYLTLSGAPTQTNHAATKQYVDDAMPTGAIIAYGGNTAPTGWHLCNGTAHGSSALSAIVGATTPDLRDKFIAGKGGSWSTSGGTDANTLVINNMPAHDHGTNTGTISQDHTHSGTTGGMNASDPHEHNSGWVSGVNGNQPGGWDGDPGYTWRVVNGEYWEGTNTSSNSVAHGHPFSTGGVSANHTHSITSQGAGVAIENRPPYYALTYIIKK